jgi:dsRNA-specific ribonuclease
MEALTAPTAHRDYDYERLEFLGDSVITFLVALENFLTKGLWFNVGDLDFYRIKTISNMNFYNVN